MFVDEKFRKPVGRAWLTVAIDVFSRCVCGFYLSYDAPSAASVGFALAHSILPKEKFLAKHGVSEKWDIWGKMTTIHADNGSDFRCEMLNRVIRDYRMHINWRPRSKPNYGGHIERLLGTFNNDIHTLPGSTFSNIQERGRYNSEKKAAFTLAEFEKWLSIYITKIYHHKIHSTINMPPIAKYEESVLGTDETPPVGHPPRFDDEIRLKLDFLPGVERSVQRYGVAINNLFYFHPLINKYINLRADETTKSKRKFLVKQDPRDITVAYFFDDFTNEYITLNLAERTIESMSLADLKMVKKALKQKGLEAVNQQTIFSGYQDTLNLTDEVIEKTKSARRNSQKRVDSKRKNKEYFAEESLEAVADEKSKKDLFSKNYEGFSDMEFD
jgi:putative transposase